MIDKREILEAASALGLLPNVVEKVSRLVFPEAGHDQNVTKRGHSTHIFGHDKK
jgi:hypothetical protein